MIAISASTRLNRKVTSPACRTAALLWMPWVCSSSPTIVTPPLRNELKIVSERAAPIALRRSGPVHRWWAILGLNE
jgi:hypothetical protein